MRITVFGATGTIGRLVVQQALAEGHEHDMEARYAVAEHEGELRREWGARF